MKNLLLAMCALVCTHTNAEDEFGKNFNKTWTADKNVGIYWESSLNANLIDNVRAFIFVTCRNSGPPKLANCKIHAESPDLHDKTCPFQMKARSGYYLKVLDQGTDLAVVALPKNKVIILWSEGGNFENSLKPDPKFMHVTIIDTFDCSVVDVPILPHITFENWSGWILSQNKLELVFTNTTLCKNSKSCKVAYNLKGKIIGEPKPFSSSNVRFFGRYVSTNPRDTGLIIGGVSSTNPRINQITYIDPTGKERVLTNGSMTMSRVSVGFGMFIVCNLSDDKVQLNCTQNQLDSNKNSAFTIKSETKISEFAVTNLAGGGFLAGLADCNITLKIGAPDNPLALTTYNCTKFSLKQVINENFSRSIEFPLNLNCSRIRSTPLSIKIVENLTGFCIRFTCSQARPVSESISLYVKCVTENDVIMGIK
ncbi:hypothetical protein QAD02_012059 [Eretmocerus hayati]|uniref:Uncharacterized protein n=1 Tax=Eretmocerus hayati TaxID=131215 RepID=A0ACC2NZJ7_9HYME|nr:hypothetical protein QAD02_012059 [Eretmocerus hayati]